MTKEMPQPEDAPDNHPTAGSKIETWRRKSERVERLSNGEVEVPWPYTAGGVAVLAGVNLAAAGGSVVWEIAVGTENALGFLAFIVFAVSAVGFGHYAKFIHLHFDEDPQPRYMDGEGE